MRVICLQFHIFIEKEYSVRCRVLSNFRRKSSSKSLRICHSRSEEHTSELQSQSNLVCRLLLAKKTRVFIIKRGQLEIIWPDPGERVVSSLGPGQFTGETSMLTGRRGLVRLRPREPCEWIECQR